MCYPSNCEPLISSHIISTNMNRKNAFANGMKKRREQMLTAAIFGSDWVEMISFY